MCTQDSDGSGRGPAKLRQLKDNSNYFRGALLRMGCTVLGDWDSPVMVCARSCDVPFSMTRPPDLSRILVLILEVATSHMPFVQLLFGCQLRVHNPLNNSL